MAEELLIIYGGIVVALFFIFAFLDLTERI